MSDYLQDVYDDERPYFLPCGCWSEWPDHRCRVGGWVRPWYCRCGAPDDCYCNEDGRYDDMPEPDDEMPDEEPEETCNVVIYVEDGRVVIHEMTPGDVVRLGSYRRAWEDNALFTFRTTAIDAALSYVSEGDLTEACVWSAGTGTWCVNGVRR